MAQTVHLTLTVDGKQIIGESSQEADGKKDTIECVYFESGLSAPRDAASGRATGHRQFKPIVIRKRIDRSSPELARALTANQCVEARFEFFRPSTSSSGSDDKFFVVTIGTPTKAGPAGSKANAYVSEIKLVMPDTMEDQASETREAYEEVSFVFDFIAWEALRDNKSQSMHDCSWSKGVNV